MLPETFDICFLVTAKDALTGGHIYVGGDEAADFGVVVAGGEIVEAGFGIVVVTAITERVVCAKCSCQGAGGGYQLAPRIVDIFYHTHAAFVHKANYIILAVYKNHSMFPSEKYLHKMILKNVQNF